MHPPSAGDYAPYYPPYPSPTSAPAPAPAPPPPTYPSASAPPYLPYPTDFAPSAAYPTYPPPPADLPHYAPPAAAPPQPYYHYEPPPPASPHNPAPSPYPSLDRTGSYGYGSGSGYGQELYAPKPAVGGWSDDGVYAYDGGDAPEPYGARGAAPRSSSSALFDDYGRSIGSTKERGGGGGSAASPKVVRAVPKVETSEDVRKGVQKFRVKLLPEGAGSPMDVLCQVGLDGIRMLDPNTSRTLRIYPLETVTRWDVLDSSIFAFWSKSSVDIEARRIRLKSNSYTTNTILDTVTAATVQFKEMGGSSISRSRAIADAAKPSEQQNERKNFLDWRNLMKPMNEEKDHWVPDEAVSKCTACAADFSAFNRRHHCRNCGDIFCDKCTQGRTPLTTDADAQPARVCDKCMAEVSQRLNNAREAANRPIVHSHEDLAKKLQVVGTHGYAAPDYIETGHLTIKSDVWSFGVVLYEILTGRRSLERSRPVEEQKLLVWVRRHPPDGQNFRSIMDPRLGGRYPAAAAREVARLADRCLCKNPKERPAMRDVVEELERVVQMEPQPPLPAKR